MKTGGWIPAVAFAAILSACAEGGGPPTSEAPAGIDAPEAAALPDDPGAASAVGRAPQDLGEFGVPGRANANVSIAAAGSWVALAWSAAESGGATDVHVAVSRDAGLTFSEPVRVNSAPGTVRVNGEQPPRIVVSSGEPDPMLTVVWTAQGRAGTTLMSAQSRDAGRSFGEASLVADTDAPGNRGWESLAALPDGRVVSAWLDHRQLAGDAEASHHHHASADDGVAMAQRSQLLIAALGVAAPLTVTGGVCYCCKTALAAGLLGAPEAVGIAWRHVYPGNMRDIAFTLSRDGGRTFGAPVRVSEDQWSIAGCPDDGPAMAVDSRGRAHIVWPTVVETGGQPTKVLFHAMTADGSTFSPRVQLPTEGQANHPQLAIGPDDSLAVTWDESGSGTRRIAFAIGWAGPDGVVRFERSPVAGEAQGVYPVVAPAGKSLIAAWTSGQPGTSMIRVMRF